MRLVLQILMAFSIVGMVLKFYGYIDISTIILILPFIIYFFRLIILGIVFIGGCIYIALNS